jgi:hypothetical protein
MNMIKIASAIAIVLLAVLAVSVIDGADIAYANAGGCPPAAAVGGADVNNGAARDSGQDAPTLAYENQFGRNPTLIAVDADEGGLGHGVHGDHSAHGYDKQIDRDC